MSAWPVVPPPSVSPPLLPSSARCFSTMLMIPATPSGFSRADGLGITSTLSTRSAGSCARKLPSCAGFSGLGRPLSWTTTAVLPQTHNVIDVHVDGRHVAQHIERRAAARGGHIADDVGDAVRRKLHVVLLSLDHDRLQLDRRGSERHRSDVGAEGWRTDLDPGELARLVADRDDADAIAA